jgi:hypothetical protein
MCAPRDARTVAEMTSVDLYWIPLGAGGHPSIRFNGRVFEALHAARRRAPRCVLFHSALVVVVDGDRYTLEIAPSPDGDEASRGVVATGAVGSRLLGRMRHFRYEVRCWRGGSIPDLDEATGPPERLTDDAVLARRVLDVIAAVPTPVWGRDELQAGEMWNSNSMIAWLIATAGMPTGHLRPPAHGRAPGWDAGLTVAGGESSAREHLPCVLTDPAHGRRRDAPLVFEPHEPEPRHNGRRAAIVQRLPVRVERSGAREVPEVGPVAGGQDDRVDRL